MQKQRWVLVAAALAAFLVGPDALVVATALPTIRRDLGASLSELEWTVNAYTLSLAVLLLCAAALSDGRVINRKEPACLTRSYFATGHT